MNQLSKVLVEDEYHINIVEGHVLNAWLVLLRFIPGIRDERVDKLHSTS